MTRRVTRTATILVVFLAHGLMPFQSYAAEQLFNAFDFDGTETFTGIGADNFVSVSDGLTPTAGSQFLASGNGNASTIFFTQGFSKDLGGTIQNAMYQVQMNIAWYNSGQDGGLRISDFDTLFIGSGNGTIDWLSTPEPIVEDQWYTWTGEFTPSPLDLGQPFFFEAVYDLPARRDIAIDLPACGFAQVIPEPCGNFVFLIGLAIQSATRTWFRRVANLHS